MPTTRVPPLWVWLVALVPALVGGVLPALTGAARAGPDETFLGFRYEVADSAQYMAVARFAADGHGLAQPNPFVTEPQSGRMVLLVLWLTGRVSALSGASLLTVYHGLAVLCSWAFFLLAWRVCCELLERPRTRTLAFLLTTCASGWGWIFRALDVPLDREALRADWCWTDWGASAFPMWTAGHALLLITVLAARRIETRDDAWLPWAGLAFAGCALAFAVHPYTGLAGIAILLTLSAQPLVEGLASASPPDRSSLRRRARFLLPALAALGLVSVYRAWGASDPVYLATAARLSEWTPQYSVWWYPLQYGLPLIAAVAGVATPAARKLILPWATAVLLLCLCPFLPGVKFQFLLHFPLCLLAALGVEALEDSLPRVRAALRGPNALVLGAALVCGGTVYVWTHGVVTKASEPYAYVETEQLKLLEALDAQPPGNVLTSYTGGALVPWRCGKAVFSGHWFLSYDLPARLEALRAFFDPEAPLHTKSELLSAQQIRYVVEDPWTRKLGTVDPGLPLDVVFENAFGRLLVVRR